MIQAKNIIFDLGGVIINIDYHRTAQRFKDLGVHNFDELYSQARQTDFFDDFEQGKISEEDFYTTMNDITQLNLSQDDIKDAWNAMLLDIPLRRLQILQQLQLHYNTVLLSNTNVIHEAAFNQQLKSVCGFQSFGVFFDKVYLSHRIGMRKPNPEIFQYVLDDCGWNASDTVFIDDSIQHIESAATLGIKTIHLQRGMTIEQDIFLNKND